MESAATYVVADSELVLNIPPDQGLWCALDHDPPLRVSGVQSGVFSGPVPMQFMVAVFDFPENAGPTDHVPSLALDWARES